MRSRGLNRWIYYGLIVLTAICLGDNFLCFPYWFDDFAFMEFLKVDCNGMPWPVDLENFWEVCKFKYYLDNIRLANFLCAISFVAPKWVSNVLFAVSWGMSLWLMGRLGRLQARRWDLMALLAAMIVLLPAWQEGLWVYDYQYNYGFGTLIMLWCMVTFMREKEVDVWPGIFVGGLMGIWNEAFSIPLLCGFVVLLMLHRCFRTRGRIWLCASMLLGVCVLMAAHGTRHRIDDCMHLWSTGWLISVRALFPVALFVVISAIGLFRRKNLWRMPLWQLLMTICAVSAVMQLPLAYSGRVSWAGQIAGCIGFVYVLSLMIRRSTLWSRVCGVALMVFMVANLVAVNVLIRKLNQENQYVIDQYRAGKPEPVVCEHTDVQQMSWLTLGHMPMHLLTSMCSFHYYHLPEGLDIKVIDPAVLDYREGLGTMLPSGDVVVYNDKFIMPLREGESVADYKVILAEMKSMGITYETALTCVPFTSEADGRVYYYVFVESTLLPSTSVRDVSIK